MKRNVSVVRFIFRCNILISGKIIKEIPGSVASGTHYICQKCCVLANSCDLCFYYSFRLYLIFILAFYEVCIPANHDWRTIFVRLPYLRNLALIQVIRLYIKGYVLEHDDRIISGDTTFDKLFRPEYGLRNMHALSKTYTT